MRQVVVLGTFLVVFAAGVALWYAICPNPGSLDPLPEAMCIEYAYPR